MTRKPSAAPPPPCDKQRLSAIAAPNGSQPPCSSRQRGITPRLPHIDLMKGVLMFFVILIHTVDQYPESLAFVERMTEDVAMPGFFFLSGLFFSRRAGFKDFLQHKAQKLVVPYLFFCLFPAIAFGVHSGEAQTAEYWQNIFALPLNGPMWFVRSLFFLMLLYYAFTSVVARWSTRLQTIVALVAGVATATATTVCHDTYFHVVCLSPLLHVANDAVVAIAMLPFFHVAAVLRDKGLLAHTPKPATLWLIVALATIPWWLCSVSGVHTAACRFGTNVAMFYVSAACGICALWCLCSIAKRLPALSYIGRHSLIVLGMHLPLVYFLQAHLTHNPFVTLPIVVLAMLPTVWIMKRVFPRLTAQRDIVCHRK